MTEENNGPDFEDGEEFEGFEERAADTDEDAFLAVPEAEEDPVIVVQDYDPATPDAELAEPQQVSTREHRTARQVRKAQQRGE